MKKTLNLLHKIFFLNPKLLLVLIVPVYASLIYILISNQSNTWYAYLLYALAFYTLTATICTLPALIRIVKKAFISIPVIQKGLTNHRIQKFMQNTQYRSEVTLHSSLLINLSYVVLKLTAGIIYRSFWLAALSIYYLLLAIMRSILVGYLHHHRPGENQIKEYRTYHVCACLLLLMNQALAVLVIFMVHMNQSFSYPGYLIYCMAMYAFYALINSIWQFIRFRKSSSAILQAAKAISLCSSLVSMLALETAMLAQFGGDEAFRKIMTSLFGGFVCTFVLILAIGMIIRSKRFLKNNPTQEKTEISCSL